MPEASQKLLAFTKRVIQLRRDYPILRRSRFLTGAHDAQLDIRDVAWLSAGGHEMTQDEWNNGWIKCFGVMLDGRARKTAVARHGEDESVLIIMNSFEGEVDFKLPRTSAGPKWTLLLDTNVDDGATATPFAFDGIYKVAGRSFALLTSADAV
jgi:glycogen operon protein